MKLLICLSVTLGALLWNYLNTDILRFENSQVLIQLGFVVTEFGFITFQYTILVGYTWIFPCWLHIVSLVQLSSFYIASLLLVFTTFYCTILVEYRWILLHWFCIFNIRLTARFYLLTQLLVYNWISRELSVEIKWHGTISDLIILQNDAYVFPLILAVDS